MAMSQSFLFLVIYALCKPIIVSSFTTSLLFSPCSTFMGCGNSKLIPEGEAVPPTIRPLLRRRFLEMRKRRNDNVLKQGRLSKKQLLKDGGDEDDDNSSPPRSEVLDCKSTSSSSSSSSKGKEKLPENPEASGEVIEEIKEQEDKKDVEIRGCSEKEDVKEEANDKQKTGEEVKEEDEDEYKEDDGSGIEDERRICPGSPSFRVFFLEATENEKEKVLMADAVAEEEEDDSSDKKTHSDDSFVSTASAASNEGQERKVSKKGGRGRAFKRAIRKGGPVAVKNLLNVKSCYHPGSASHDRASLLEAKAAAA